ncbi:hypothetical protein [Caldimonas sp. KR1-144]|uniref:hypothetical protein n=1 Tax=Caldimonas sp. KR1-144 TaxID=3400911 RepID=UPI003C0E4F14
MKTSTGLRNAMLASGSLKSLLDNGVLRIYGGSVPSTADEAIGGATLLCEITEDGLGGGLDFAAAAVGGVLAKLAGQVWAGTPVATGTATFFRFVQTGDTGAVSTTAPRLQGTCGTAGADLNMTSTALVSGTPLPPVDFFNVALPTL